MKRCRFSQEELEVAPKKKFSQEELKVVPKGKGLTKRYRFS
jgi:hypothetical protein